MPEDKKNFATLLQELREAFDKNEAGRLLLTAAVPHGKYTIDRGYDVPAMSKSLDFINVMTYDFHSWSKDNPRTGHNSPLYGNGGRNSDATISYFIERGADPKKLLLGLASYGHGYTLADPKCNGMNCLATGPIEGGNCTHSAGVWSYNDFCEDSQFNEWTIVRVCHS